MMCSPEGSNKTSPKQRNAAHRAPTPDFGDFFEKIWKTPFLDLFWGVRAECLKIQFPGYWSDRAGKPEKKFFEMSTFRWNLRFHRKTSFSMKFFHYHETGTHFSPLQGKSLRPSESAWYMNDLILKPALLSNNRVFSKILIYKGVILTFTTRA